MRFKTPPPRQSMLPRLPFSWRVISLCGLLVLVLLAMQRLQTRDAQRTLARVFQLNQGGQRARAESPSPQAGELPPLLPGVDVEQLRLVSDNADHRAAENPAWLAIMQSVDALPVDQFRRLSFGPVTQAQLVSRPEHYRGRVVAVSGTLVEVAEFSRPTPDLSPATYYRLHVVPEGGPRHPLAIYCPRLPTGLELGSDLDLPFACDAVFFKVWSFPAGEEQLLAPVLYTKHLAAELPQKRTDANSASLGWKMMVPLIGALVIGGVLLGCLLARAPHRRPGTLPEDPQEHDALLQKLAALQLPQADQIEPPRDPAEPAKERPAE